MPSCPSRSARALPENHGNRRENGTDRTSATAVTSAFLSSDRKRSTARLEWPIVNKSKSPYGVMGLLSASRALLFRKLTSDSRSPLQAGRAYAIFLVDAL